MKRALSVVIALTIMMTMVFSCFTLSASATKNTGEVGAMSTKIWKEFVSSDSAEQTAILNKVTKLIREEFNRTSKLRSFMFNGEKYFDFGEPTGEKVHSWASTGTITYNEQEHAAVGSMNQDFTGGHSTCKSAFSQPPQWACILVTKASYDKGEAYTVRDSVASAYASSGGPNGDWGFPITNQFWVVEGGIEVLYQKFDNCYVSFKEGKDLSAFKTVVYKWDDPAAYDACDPSKGTWERPSYAAMPEPSEGGIVINPTEPIAMPDFSEFEIIEEAAPDETTEDPGAAEDPVDGEDPADGDESTDETSSSDETSSEGESNVSDGEDVAEGNAQATTSTKVTTHKKNSPFLQFMIDNMVIIIVAAVVVVAAVAALVIVLVAKKKKAVAPAEESAEAPAEKENKE